MAPDTQRKETKLLSGMFPRPFPLEPQTSSDFWHPPTPASEYPELQHTASFPPFLLCACSRLNGMLSPTHLQVPKSCPHSQGCTHCPPRPPVPSMGSRRALSKHHLARLPDSLELYISVQSHNPLSSNCLVCTSFLLRRRESPKGQQGPRPLLTSTCHAAPSTGPCSWWVLRKHL